MGWKHCGLAKAIGGLALLQLGLGAGPLAAQNRDSIRALFPAQPTGYVTDVAGVVDPASRDSMTVWIERLRSATGAEIAVVTLPTIGDYAASDVALEIGRTWGVGAKAEIGDQRRNAGIVLLLVPQQNHQPGTGHIFIATGQGTEGIITDATAGQVRDLMTPQLARERYGPGLLIGVRALVGLVARGFGVDDSTLTAQAPPAPSRNRGRGWPALPFIIFVALIILFNLFGRGGRGGRGGRRGPGVFPWIYWGGGGFGGGWGGGGGGGGGFGGGFGGFGGGGGFSGGGAGGRF